MSDDLQLIELPKEKLSVGMALKFTLRDKSGMTLLAKGQRIENAAQLDGIKARGRVFVELDESDESVRVMMQGLTQMTIHEAPLKDFSKFVQFGGSAAGAEEDKLTGSLPQRWSDVESKLRGLLASSDKTTDFVAKIKKTDSFIQALCTEDPAGSLFILFNRGVTQFTGYSALHSLHCAVLGHLVAGIFKLPENERQTLVCAALTMNIGMMALQDELALQRQAPSPVQRTQIDGHGRHGRQMLEAAGVSDPLWLAMVAAHHARLEVGENILSWPVHVRLTYILQTLDRYTAAMAPRKSRAGRTARDTVRSIVVQPGGSNKPDEAGSALVRLLGLCPPGTYVKLTAGETAVVLRRGIKPAEPVVATVLNKSDEPIALPRLQDTSRPGLQIQATLSATSIRVNLNLETMLKLIPRN